MEFYSGKPDNLAASVRDYCTGVLTRHLGIAEKTVKVHRSHIIEKLGKRSPIELAQFCAAANIEPASPPPNS